MWIAALLLAQTPIDRPVRHDVLRIRLTPAQANGNNPPLLKHRRLKFVKPFGGDEQTEAAVEDRLSRLSRLQSEEGSWSDGAPGDGLGVTSRVLLAFSAAGYGTASRPHGAAIRKGIDWLTRRQEPSGGWGDDFALSALAAAALAETAVRHPHGGLLDADSRARDYVMARRGDRGAWGRTPWSSTPDPEATFWATVATTLLGPARLPGLSGEHAAFAAWDRGPYDWKRWLERERGRLLIPATTPSSLASQATDLTTPYRFRLWRPDVGGRLALSAGPPSPGRAGRCPSSRPP